MLSVAGENGPENTHNSRVNDHDLSIQQAIFILLQGSSDLDTEADALGSAVSIWGDTALIGASNADLNDSDVGQLGNGAAYIFTWSADAWVQDQRLSASDGNASDNFGRSVSVDDNHFGYSVSVYGGRALIGAYGNDHFGEDAGSAAIFEVSQDGTWQHMTTLYASDAQEGDQFGYSVALTADSAVVGANLEDSEGTDAGAAYIFEYVTSVATPYWRQDAKVTAGTVSSQFGFSVSHSPARVLVGSPFSAGTGTAYIFQRGNASLARIPLVPTGVVEFDNYGYSVSVSSQWALVGANGDGFAHSNQGAAYMFEFDTLSSQWGPSTRLTASDGEGSDAFGHSVSLSGSRAIIGAPFMNSIRGTAYMFDYVDDTWQETQILLPADETNYGRFGWSVDVYNKRAIIGAYQDGAAGDDAGSAYIFNFLEDSWIQTKKFIAKDIDAGDYFGNSVSVSVDNMLLGAPNNSNENGANAGIAYIYRQAGPVIYADGFETVE